MPGLPHLKPLAVGAFNLVGRDFVFGLVAPGEDDERCIGADQLPTTASHQMCQIRAKPMRVAKNALTKPVGLFFGISIGS